MSGLTTDSRDEDPAGPRTYVGFGFGAIQAGLFLAEAQASGNFSRLVVADVDPGIVRAVREAGGCFRVGSLHAGAGARKPLGRSGEFTRVSGTKRHLSLGSLSPPYYKLPGSLLYGEVWAAPALSAVGYTICRTPSTRAPIRCGQIRPGQRYSTSPLAGQ